MGRDNSAISLKETQKPNKEKIHRGKGKRKSSNEDKDKDGKNKKAFGLIKNKDQVPEFKMKEGESWGKFQGKSTNFLTKFKDTIMCPRFYMKGHCHKRYKWAASHVAAKDVPKDIKKKYCAYLDQIQKLE